MFQLFDVVKIKTNRISSVPAEMIGTIVEVYPGEAYEVEIKKDERQYECHVYFGQELELYRD